MMEALGLEGHRALQAAGGSATSIEIDLSLRFSESTDASAAKATVQSYVSSDASQGGNGLLEDLQAAAPALASRLQVDASATQFESEVLAVDTSVTDVSETAVSEGGDGPSVEDESEGDGDAEEDSGVGGLIGGAIGGIIVLVVVITAVYCCCCRGKQEDVTGGPVRGGASTAPGFAVIIKNGQTQQFQQSNPIRQAM